jgi:nucleosome assembly protein 1-like 1
MGKKKDAPEAEAPKKEPEGDEEEDTPVIKQLKGIDDKYCAIEVELEKEIEKMRKKYDERQAPLIAERQKVLYDTSEAPAEVQEFGTPACPDFWLQALSNAGEFEELLHECDEPVLKYLNDITRSYPDPEQPQKAIRLEFTFKENPYFTNTVLWLEAHFDYDTETYKPYKETDCCEVKSCPIEWKPGKDITVEKVKKESAGKKGGKRKPGKAKEEPIPSFFRILFCSLKTGDTLPEGLECVYVDEDDEEDELTECHLQNIGEVAQFIAQMFLPYAVRYYTGEAADDDDDDDDEESEEEDDDDDDDDESSEEPPARGRKGKAAPKKKSSGDAAEKGEKGEKTEECKQQ